MYWFIIHYTICISSCTYSQNTTLVYRWIYFTELCAKLQSCKEGPSTLRSQTQGTQLYLHICPFLQWEVMTIYTCLQSFAHRKDCHSCVPIQGISLQLNCVDSNLGAMKIIVICWTFVRFYLQVGYYFSIAQYYVLHIYFNVRHRLEWFLLTLKTSVLCN